MTIIHSQRATKGENFISYLIFVEVNRSFFRQKGNGCYAKSDTENEKLPQIKRRDITYIGEMTFAEKKMKQADKERRNIIYIGESH